MQQIHEEIDGPGTDEELFADCDVPEALEYWSIDEFRDVLATHASMVEAISDAKESAAAE